MAGFGLRPSAGVGNVRPRVMLRESRKGHHGTKLAVCPLTLEASRRLVAAKKSISHDAQIEYDGRHQRDRSTHITYNAALGHTRCRRHDHLVYHRPGVRFIACLRIKLDANSVAPALKDWATSRTGHSALQNVTFECARVKTRKCKSSDNLALRGPSLMSHAFCAWYTTNTNSDRATQKV